VGGKNIKKNLTNPKLLNCSVCSYCTFFKSACGKCSMHIKQSMDILWIYCTNSSFVQTQMPCVCSFCCFSTDVEQNMEIFQLWIMWEFLFKCHHQLGFDLDLLQYPALDLSSLISMLSLAKGGQCYWLWLIQIWTQTWHNERVPRSFPVFS